MGDHFVCRDRQTEAQYVGPSRRSHDNQKNRSQW
jgi:hypothetical protein